MVGISRKAMGYQSLREQRDRRLVERLKALGEQYPRYGYPMLHGLLKGEGLVINPMYGLLHSTFRRVSVTTTREEESIHVTFKYDG